MIVSGQGRGELSGRVTGAGQRAKGRGLGGGRTREKGRAQGVIESVEGGTGLEPIDKRWSMLRPEQGESLPESICPGQGIHYGRIL